MAGEAQTPAPSRSPWLYRYRALVFGTIYGFGFLAGNVVADLIGLSSEPAFRSFGHPVALAALAIACAVLGFALRWWGSSYLPASIVFKPDVQTEALRVSGPYRFARNPLYLGNVLQAVGVGLLGPWPVLVLILVAILAYTFYLIATEERFLRAAHGLAFERYCAAVPALIPLPGKSLPDAGQERSPGGGARSEIFSAVIALGVIAGVLTLP